MHPRLQGAPILALCLLLVAQPAQADADDQKKACIDAVESGQVAKKDGRLRDALGQFSRCAEPSCPGRVQSRCVAWHAEVEAALPTIVLLVRDRTGKELTERITLEIDGKSVTIPPDGRALPVDPGSRLIRVALERDRSVYGERRLVLREGQKSVQVELVLPIGIASSASSSVLAPPASSAERVPEPSVGKRPFPTLGVVFASIGAASLATFAIFAGLGKSQENSLRNSCAPACGSDDKTSLMTKYIVADISLGLGLVSAGLATYFFLTNAPKREAPRGVAWFLAPSSQGASLSMRGEF